MPDFLFFDWETCGPDLTVIGTLNYVLDPKTDLRLLSWRFETSNRSKLWAPDLSDKLPPEVWAYVRDKLDDVGEPPRDLIQHIEDGGFAVAWNAAFDRHVWQQVATPLHGFPELRSAQVLDAMAQAQASNLPGKLDLSGRALGLGQKTYGGTAVMKAFADPDVLPTDLKMWGIYLDYSGTDTDLLASVWQNTRPLDREEWHEYHVSEKINDRGMMVDLDICRGATQYREEEAEHIAEECTRITQGVITKPTLTKQINEWVYDRLPDDLAEFMVKERDDEGYVTRLTMDKNVIGRLIEEIDLSDAPPGDDVLDLLEVLEYGRSSSAVKFEKMLNQACDGRLCNSYVFNGAGQTGRYCVAADTKIETPYGSRHIVDLRKGDEVITHRGRAKKVLDLIYKGREQMYRLQGPLGEIVDATMGHQIWTFGGWKKLSECFEKTSEGSETLRTGCEPVSVYAYDYERHSRGAGRFTPHRQRHTEARLARRRTHKIAGRKSLAEENRRGKPDVRPEDGGRKDITQWPGGGMDWERLRFRAPENSRQDAWLEDITQASGSTPHRRRQGQQRSKQSGGSNQTRASVFAQANTWTLIPLGERDVWDIAVAGDESYVAQGLIHHNSSRGVQVHNLPRSKMKNELDLLDMIARREPIEVLREYGPLSATLAKLIRPTIIAPEGKTLVWGDWSAIEARVLPWLANTSRARKAVLEPFENGEDLYLLNAAEIFDIDLEELTERYADGDPEVERMRQGGKIGVLSLGFGGSVGAYRAMARGYGLRIANEEAKVIVDGWRSRNRWARAYWNQLEIAAFSAIDRHDTVFEAGRVKYIFYPGLMGGTLCCYLPCGRPIVYPKARIEMKERFGTEKETITYLNGMGRSSMWYGKQAENITQATAGSLLRATLTRLEREEDIGETVGHTHDEVIEESPVEQARGVADRLKEIMTRGFDWTEGLPLKADIVTDWYYHK